MSVDFSINAETRTDTGKGASRRLRHADLTPAIVYGGGADAVSITLKHNEVLQHVEHEAFFSHILDLNLDGKVQKVVLRDMQRHPSKHIVMHMDFLRVSDKEALTMHVPLHFTGEDVAPGVKVGGGVVSHLVIEVEVSCLPKDLPEYIEVDMSKLELGDSVHLSDLTLPEGVSLVELSHGDDHDGAVASIHATRAALEEDDEGTPAEAGDADEAADDAAE